MLTVAPIRLPRILDALAVARVFALGVAGLGLATAACDVEPDPDIEVFGDTEDFEDLDALAAAVDPVQTPFADGTRVRLRHAHSDKCIYARGTNTGYTRNWSCWDSPGMVFVLDDAGNGRYRIRHEGTDQCLYTLSTDGAEVGHSECWSDPALEFELIPYMGGYRIRNHADGVSLYGNEWNGGHIRSKADAQDCDLIFYIEDLGPLTGEWTGWLNRDTPGGDGDYELHHLYNSADVCASPSYAICETLDGEPWTSMGENVSCTASGLGCTNASQPDNQCEDYRVKFYCP
ncbi:hypothetical protein [Paraliomyxa miuraensis]|uniref:hypothetical protein n=1 Tax=Paraliomyxa miuraensis TaxID=376150 RepID=UPI0022501EE2|nr:hypothetical protein [Paraliomyxa miuraensis]MCX4245278.1 hypothetical protein [Paraliomyxa miuraensis]